VNKFRAFALSSLLMVSALVCLALAAGADGIGPN